MKEGFCGVSFYSCNNIEPLHSPTEIKELLTHWGSGTTTCLAGSGPNLSKTEKNSTTNSHVISSISRFKVGYKSRLTIWWCYTLQAYTHQTQKWKSFLKKENHSCGLSMHIQTPSFSVRLVQVWAYRLTLRTHLFLSYIHLPPVNMLSGTLILHHSFPAFPDLLNPHLFPYLFLWNEQAPPPASPLSLCNIHHCISTCLSSTREGSRYYFLPLTGVITTPNHLNL